MARGRPRKDGTKAKETKKIETEQKLEGQETKKVKRKAATAAIQKVMDKYNISSADGDSRDVVDDMEVADEVNNHTEDANETSNNSATCTLLFSTLGLHNSSKEVDQNNTVSDKSDSKDLDKESLPNVTSIEEKITDTSSLSPKNTIESTAKSSSSETPSKSWTDAIWGPSSSTSSSEASQLTQSSCDNTNNDLKSIPTLQSDTMEEKSSISTELASNTKSKSKSSSSVSTPCTSSSGTPRSETPEVAAKPRKSSSKKSSKTAKVRRRIRTLEDMDSEDSEVSTDSPLKPKTYSVNEKPESTPVLRSTRIPKKTKNDVKTEVKSETADSNNTSPVEEPPLIPKGFLQQQKKEQELRGNLEENSDSKIKKHNIKLEMTEEDKAEVDRRIKEIKQLKENQYLCKKVINKQSKKMQCDCSLSKEEHQQGVVGCGDDCLNRLLYIECGKPCILESNCSNKRFQNNQYADVEVFKTEWKGVGLRARSYIPKDTFIMEYVGEVLDTRLFRKRAKQYAKDQVQHFYFMALSKDQFVDATCKGNISRFINHSCDPNAETQKWTVNGELRVGFFTKRSIQPGEEVSFDYKYERYGNVAQKCYCGTSRCRGWLGGEPGSDSGIEEVDEWSDEDDDEEEALDTAETFKKEKKKKERKKREKKTKKIEVDDCEEDIERLMQTGVRNRNQTLQLCRLMVRATRLGARLKLADMIFEADQPCLRLFLDYQGLRILYSWMFELEWSMEELELKLRIQTVLSILPMPHKTILVDSKVFQTIQKWIKDSPNAVTNDEGVESNPVSRTTTPTPASSPKKDSQETSEQMDVDEASGEETTCVSSASPPAPPPDTELFPPGEEPEEEEDNKMPGCVEESVGAVLQAQAGVADQQQETAELEDVSMEEVRVKPVAREELPLSEEEEKIREDMDGKNTQVELTDEEQMVRDIQERARDLMEAWSCLQEMFKIPKKERQAERREHEREADRSDRGSYSRDESQNYNNHQENSQRDNRRLSTNSQYPNYKSYNDSVSRDKYQENTRETYGGPVRGGFTGNRRNLRLDDRTGRLCKGNLYRGDRRMLFQAKVEEENRQKVLRHAVSARHEQCCLLLGMKPQMTPMLPKYPEFYLAGGKWVPMPPPPLPIDPSWTTPMMAALPPEAFSPDDPPLPNPRSIYPPGCYPEPTETSTINLDQSVTEKEICAYYDKMYYGESVSCNSTPSPVQRSPLSEAISAQLDHHPIEFTASSQDLSPDYRSPSPVNQSSSSPPTSLQFLSSSPSVSETVLQSQAQDVNADYEDQSLSHDVNNSTEEVIPQSTSLNVEPAAQNIHKDGGDNGGMVVRIPPKWRTARDASGRVYYYHVVTKQTQWEIPNYLDADDEEAGDSVVNSRDEDHRVETNDTDSDEDGTEDGDDTDTEEESEEENEENGSAAEQEPEVSEIPDSDLSASEKRMLLRMRRRTKEERRNMRRIKREKFKERHEQERMVTRERHKRHRRDGLVMEHLVPARIFDKDKQDLMTFKEMRERLLNKDKIREQQMKEEREEEEKERREERAKIEKIRREEKRAADKAKREAEFRHLTAEDAVDTSISSTPDNINVSLSSSTPSSSVQTPQQGVTSSSNTKVKPKTTQAAADTSSDVDKKHKDKFVKEMSKVVVKILDPYRKKGVKGHIGNTDDFKHLAKKLTFTIMQKELKVCKSTEELKAKDKVKKRASDFVSKYMKKYEREYKRSPNQAD